MHLIRHADLRSAMDPTRHLVKLSEQFLWKSSAPPGPAPWRQGTEIHSESLGISLFEPGATQKAHLHRDTWEMYQVLEGTLRIALREPNGRWICIGLGPLDMMIIRPGTAHLVESGGSHLTQVIQAPPAGGDQVVVDGERETLAALEVLRRGC